MVCLNAQYKDCRLSLHIKLIWYFLQYLETMTYETIDRWNLIEKNKEGMMERYRFYRKELKGYDDKLSRKCRGTFTKIGKALLGL